MKRPVRAKKSIQKILTDVVEKLMADYQPEKIILYGSYAYGQPNEDSDIDLFIIKETDKRRIDRFVEVSEIIYDPQRHISIQPMVYTPGELEERLALGDDFVKDILTRGEIIYAR
jgi:uncharacterized protein